MISDAEVEKAISFIGDNADKAAEARAHRLYLQEFRKSLKAMVMTEHEKLPLGAQEREAYSDKRYLDHLKGYRQAVFEDERMQWRMEASKATLDAWRTMRADIRGAKI